MSVSEEREIKEGSLEEVMVRQGAPVPSLLRWETVVLSLK